VAMRCDPALVERARVLIEGSPRTLEDIAVELGVAVQSLRNCIKKYGGRRHPEAPRAVPKLPPEKEGPARRLYESGAAVADLAALLSCHESYVHRLAKQRGWGRGAADRQEEEEEDAPLWPPSPELNAIAKGLCDPDLTRDGCSRLVQRLIALTAADVLDGRDAGIERRLDFIQAMVRLAKDYPEEPPAYGGCEASPEDEERERERLIDEIARKYEALVGVEEVQDRDAPTAGADLAAS
jgi:hypothetical protein